MGIPTAALIGSFRRHYLEVLEVHTALTAQGVTVTTPTGGSILDLRARFVRFDTDKVGHSDEHVQCLALHRILRADAVYVVAPQGYVGRTTCYEIGRCMQAGQPLYFSERPADLPIAVPASHVVTPSVFAACILDRTVSPMIPFLDKELADYERRLLSGDYDES